MKVATAADAMKVATALLLLSRASAMRSILDELMDGYDNTARPSDSDVLGQPWDNDAYSCISDNGRPDPVFIDFGIEELVSVDQLQLKFQLDGYFRGRWTDPRLAFPAGVCRDQIIRAPRHHGEAST